MSHLSNSLTPFWWFIHPRCHRTVTPTRLRFHWLRHPHDLADLSRSISTGQAHEDEQFGCLTKPVLNTGDEVKEFDKITSVDDDTTHINLDHNVSDLPKTTNENTRKNVFPVFESSILNVSHWWFCSPERRHRKHAVRKLFQDWETKQKVLWSVLQNRCQD